MDTRQILIGLETDNSQAQNLFFQEYYKKLLSLVQANLHGRLRRRVDASDIALSAIRSFLVDARDKPVELETRTDVWKLLVTITLNKMRSQARRHNAEKRALSRETGDEVGKIDYLSDHEPGPEDVAMLNSELEAILADLKPYHREIGERLILGERSSSIAHVTQRSIRTVRRVESALEEGLIRRIKAVD